METADWVLFTTSAALVKLPVSAMAMKVRNWSTSISAVMSDPWARSLLRPAIWAGRTISPILIGQIKNIRFTNQSFGSKVTVLREESGGGFGWFRRMAG